MADGSAGGPADQAPGTKAHNVLPTQSPGPFVNNPSDPDNPTRGRSVGGFHQDGYQYSGDLPRHFRLIRRRKAGRVDDDLPPRARELPGPNAGVRTAKFCPGLI